MKYCYVHALENMFHLMNTDGGHFKLNFHLTNMHCDSFQRVVKLLNHSKTSFKTQFNCNQTLHYTFTDEQSKYCKGYERTRYPSSVDTTPSLTIPNPTDKPNVRDDPYTSNGGSHSSNVYKPNLYGGKDDPLSKSRISIASSVIFQSVVYSERLLTHVTITVLVWILPTWHDIICFNKY